MQRPVLEVLNENYKKSKKYIYDINFKKKIKKEKKYLVVLLKGLLKILLQKNLIRPTSQLVIIF